MFPSRAVFALLVTFLLLLPPHAATPAAATDPARFAPGEVALRVDADLDALAGDLLGGGLANAPWLAGARPVLERVRDLGKGRARGLSLTLLGVESSGRVDFLGVFDAGSGLDGLRAILSGSGAELRDYERGGVKGFLMKEAAGETLVVAVEKNTLLMGRPPLVEAALAAKPAKRANPAEGLAESLPKAERARAVTLGANFTPALRASAQGATLPEALHGFGVALGGKSLALRFVVDRPEEAKALAAELARAAKGAAAVTGATGNSFGALAAELAQRAKIEAKDRTVRIAATFEEPVFEVLGRLFAAAPGATAAEPGDAAKRGVCESALRQLDGAGDLYLLDNPKAAPSDLSVERLLAAGYLKATPVCPAGGVYSCSAKGSSAVWSCSVHGGKK